MSIPNISFLGDMQYANFQNIMRDSERNFQNLKEKVSREFKELEEDIFLRFNGEERDTWLKVLGASKEDIIEELESMKNKGFPDETLKKIATDRPAKLELFQQSALERKERFRRNGRESNLRLDRLIASTNEAPPMREFNDSPIQFKPLSLRERLLSAKVAPLNRSNTDSTEGFGRSLFEGAKESGEQFISFAEDLTDDPVETGKNIVQATSLLVDLACQNEWETIGKALSPEMHKLATDWSDLSWQQRRGLGGGMPSENLARIS